VERASSAMLPNPTGKTHGPRGAENCRFDIANDGLDHDEEALMEMLRPLALDQIATSDWPIQMPARHCRDGSSASPARALAMVFSRPTKRGNFYLKPGIKSILVRR